MKSFRISIIRIGMICLMIMMALGSSYTPAHSMPSATRTNTEVKFIVYPDGTVEVSSNSTSVNEYSGPSITLNTQFNKTAGNYTILLNATLTVPPETATTFPLNATTARVDRQCKNNITTTTLSASVTLCDSFSEFDFNSFPFNSTDLSITGNYTNQGFNGTITIHLIPGLTIGDINVNFEGNLTHAILSDSVRVYYNYTLPIDFPELNETSLNRFLEQLNTTIPGTSEGSLYNMTGGRLICTTFNTTLTPIDDNCTDVKFFIVIKAAEGDFIQLLSNILTGGGMGIPYTVNPYPLINATVYSIKNASFSMSYSKLSKTFMFNSILTQNLTEWQKMYTETAPNVCPSELRPYIEPLLNTTYTSIYSFTEALNYSNGQAKYKGTYTLSGDLNAQVNYIKNVYLDILTTSATMPEWLINTIKSTDINITTSQFNLLATNTSQRWGFSGVKLAPPVHYINATVFTLENFFNITAALSENGREPPGFNETLKLTVQGGSNGTHTVTVHFNPDEVPEPNVFLRGNILVWNNQSISKLKHLIFKVWEGKAEMIFNPTLITPSNPYTINATRETSCILNISSISQSTIINIKNATLPDAPLPGAYNFSGICVEISASENVTINATLRIYYSPTQLSSLGLDELSLKIFYFNTTSNQWEEMETILNTSKHYAETTISHLSLLALFAEPFFPIWQEWWFLAVIAIAVIVVAVLFLIKRKAEKV